MLSLRPIPAQTKLISQMIKTLVLFKFHLHRLNTLYHRAQQVTNWWPTDHIHTDTCYLARNLKMSHEVSTNTLRNKSTDIKIQAPSKNGGRVTPLGSHTHLALTSWNGVTSASFRCCLYSVHQSRCLSCQLLSAPCWPFKEPAWALWAGA